MTQKPLLQHGDTIGVFSPSSALKHLNELKPAEEYLKTRGYSVFIHPQTGEKFNQSAGSHTQKVAAFHELLLNPDIKVIWASRGGNRASQFLDLIDYDLWEQHPKPIIGYSDTTALHCAGLSKAGVACIQGPLFREIGTPSNPEQSAFLLNLLEGKQSIYPTQEVTCLNSGQAEGRLIGGTLFLIQSMIGTPYLPDMTGAILYLEDIGEELSRLDRTLQHLKTALPFENLGAIMFGDFINCQDTGTPYGFTLNDIIQEHIKDLDIPVLTNLPFGHGGSLYALPFGQKAYLEATRNQITLSF